MTQDEFALATDRGFSILEVAEHRIRDGVTVVRCRVDTQHGSRREQELCRSLGSRHQRLVQESIAGSSAFTPGGFEFELLVRELRGGLEYLSLVGNLPPDPFVVDIGSHVGSAMLEFSRLSPARIICIEPSELTYSALAANVALHGLEETVSCMHVAAGADIGKTRVFTSRPATSLSTSIIAEADAESFDAARLTSALKHMLTRTSEYGDAIDWGVSGLMNWFYTPRSERVESLTIPDILSQHGIDHVDLLKIDAEHSEIEILRSLDTTSWASLANIAMECDVDLVGQAVLILERAGFAVTVRSPSLAPVGTEANTVLIGASRSAARSPARRSPQLTHYEATMLKVTRFVNEAVARVDPEQTILIDLKFEGGSGPVELPWPHGPLPVVIRSSAALVLYFLEAYNASPHDSRALASLFGGYWDDLDNAPTGDDRIRGIAARLAAYSVHSRMVRHRTAGSTMRQEATS